jgi:hypothetical protein
MDNVMYHRKDGNTMLNADTINEDQIWIDGKWVVARPVNGTLWGRVKDAFTVLTNKADAVKFYKQ